MPVPYFYEDWARFCDWFVFWIVLVKHIGLDKICTILVRIVGASIARPSKIYDFRMIPGKIYRIFACRRRILSVTKSADDRWSPLRYGSYSDSCIWQLKSRLFNLHVLNMDHKQIERSPVLMTSQLRASSEKKREVRKWKRCRWEGGDPCFFYVHNSWINVKNQHKIY